MIDIVAEIKMHCALRCIFVLSGYDGEKKLEIYLISVSDCLGTV